MDRKDNFKGEKKMKPDDKVRGIFTYPYSSSLQTIYRLVHKFKFFRNYVKFSSKTWNYVRVS